MQLAASANRAVRKVDQYVASVAVEFVERKFFARADTNVEVAYLRLWVGKLGDQRRRSQDRLQRPAGRAADGGHPGSERGDLTDMTGGCATRPPDQPYRE